jgi:hypothetical protein
MASWVRFWRPGVVWVNILSISSVLISYIALLGLLYEHFDRLSFLWFCYVQFYVIFSKCLWRLYVTLFYWSSITARLRLKTSLVPVWHCRQFSCWILRAEFRPNLIFTECHRCYVINIVNYANFRIVKEGHLYSYEGAALSPTACLSDSKQFANFVE